MSLWGSPCGFQQEVSSANLNTNPSISLSNIAKAFFTALRMICFFPGVDCSLELTTWFLFISRAYADCRDSVDVRTGGHLIYTTSRKRSQKLRGVWRSHLSQGRFSETNNIKIVLHRTLHFLSQHTTPGPSVDECQHNIQTESKNFSWSLEYLDLSWGMTSWAFHISQKPWHMWL